MSDVALEGRSGHGLTPRPGCPKRMVYGPCGGVRPGGSCELDQAHACPFVGAKLVEWDPGAAHRGRAEAVLVVPRVMTDLRVRPYDAASIRTVGAILASAADAVLVGDHQNRPDFPPSFVAALLLDAGVSPWVVLTCRDRNRIALEAEAAALAALGVGGVHCVTGDARGSGTRLDADGVFELDALRLTALVAATGVAVSVAATPAAPPLELRPARLAQKQRAGASMAIVNYAGGPDRVAAFGAAARRAGSTLPLVACVPVYTDAGSAALLAGFPGVALDLDRVAAVLAAPDPVAAGINAAVDEACAMLATGEVAGVDLSGAATTGAETTSATILAETARRVRERCAG